MTFHTALLRLALLISTLSATAEELILDNPSTAVQEREDLDFDIKDRDTDERYLVTLEGIEQTDSHFLIHLSDGSSWIIRIASTQIQNWHPGDDIRLSHRLHKKNKPGNFILKNARTLDVVFVDFDFSSKDKVQGITIDKIDRHGYFLSTSDGLEWTVSWAYSWKSYLWRKGQKLLINPGSYDDGRYLLMDVETGEAISAEVTVWKA